MLEESALTTKSTDSLVTNLKQLLNNEDMFPDVVFVVENRRVYAHKAILAVQNDLRVEPTDAMLASLERLFGGAVAELR